MKSSVFIRIKEQIDEKRSTVSTHTNKRHRKRKGQTRMGNPEKLVTRHRLRQTKQKNTKKMNDTVRTKYRMQVGMNSCAPEW